MSLNDTFQQISAYALFMYFSTYYAELSNEVQEENRNKLTNKQKQTIEQKQN